MKATLQGMVAVSVLAAVLVGGCSTNQPTGLTDETVDSSQIRIYLTDAPFPYDTVRSVEVYITSIAASASTDTAAGGASDDWIDVTEPRRRFDLLTVQRGATVLVGEGTMPAGQYRAVRMVVDTDSSLITYLDGTEAPVQWQVAGEITLNALVEAPLEVPEAGADIVIDFDVGRSFPWMRDRFVFLPWFRAVNEAATGGIEGTVSWERGPGYEFIAGAGVTVYRGDAAMPSNTWSIAATGQTDSAGHYAIHYLLADRYIVTTDPPFSLALGSDTAYDAVVSARELSTVDFVLPQWAGSPLLVISGPATVAVGDSVILHATLFDASGDTVINPGVTWWSGDTTVAAVNGSGSEVAVAGRAVGTAPIVALSEALSDTLWLAVVGDSSGGSGAAFISISGPTSLAVGDSALLFASVFDANGDSVVNPAVSWTSLDTAVAVTWGGGQHATVLGLAPGTAEIVARSDTVSDTLSITVVQDTTGSLVDWVTIQPESTSLAVGDSVLLFATPRDSAGNALTGRVVSWYSPDSGLVTVVTLPGAAQGNEGDQALVYGLVAGTATVWAAVDGVVGTAAVTVTQSSAIVTGAGTIGYVGLQTGFYVIRSDSGRVFNPMALPTGFEVHGLRVRFRVLLRPDVATIPRYGETVEVLSIDRL